MSRHARVGLGAVLALLLPSLLLLPAAGPTDGPNSHPWGEGGGGNDRSANRVLLAAAATAALHQVASAASAAAPLQQCRPAVG